MILADRLISSLTSSWGPLGAAAGVVSTHNATVPSPALGYSIRPTRFT